MRKFMPPRAPVSGDADWRVLEKMWENHEALLGHIEQEAERAIREAIERGLAARTFPG